MNRIPMTLLVFWLAGPMAKGAEPGLTIVTDGRPAAVVVIDSQAGPEVRYAAAELCDYVERISGARLDLRHGGQAKPRAHPTPIKIGVDESLLPRLGEDGFVIRVNSEGVGLRGATALATVYAVYAFLEEQLGCRWFFPIELGEDVAQHKTITINAIEKEYRPDFRFRHIGGTSRLGWNLKNRLSEDLKIGTKRYGKVWGVAHTFYRLLPIEKYFEQHPEWSALIGGKRRGPTKRATHGPQICTSNPEAIREVARRINAMFDEDPGLMMITLGPNDGLSFCECPACQAQDEPGRPWRGAGERTQWRGQLSRRLMRFYNQVARLVKARHPDRLLKVMVYSWYQEPPSDPSLRFEDNVVVMLTHSGNPSRYESLYPSCYNHALTDPACRPNQERFVPALKGWRQRSQRLGIYEYYNKASVCQVAFPIVHTIRQDVPYYRSLGVEYFYTQGNGQNAGMIGLNYYVTARLLWDVDADVDALLSDFYTRFYRQAAGPMQQYHELMEGAMAARGGDVLGWLFFTTRVYDDDLVRRLRALLTQAEQRAGSDLLRKRVELARTTLEYTLLVKTLWQEVENGYRKLRDGAQGQISAKELCRKLSERVKPYQEAVVRYVEGQEPLRWMNRRRDNYRDRLLGPRIGSVYHSLLPPDSGEPSPP